MPTAALPATLAAAVAPVLWGTTYWTTTELLPPERPMMSAALRALPAGLLLLALARQLPTRGQWLRLAALGTLNIGAFFALLFYAAYALPGGSAATLSSLAPVFVLGFGALWLSVRPRRLHVVSALTAVVGVAFVVGGAAAPDPAGAAAAVGASVCMAGGVVLTRRWALPLSTFALTGWQLCLGGLLLLPVAALSGESLPYLDASALLGYSYLGFLGTAVAYLLWMRGIRRLPLAGLSALGCLSPVTAALIDWAVLDQPFTRSQLFGAALVLGAVVASQSAGSTAPAHLPPARVDPSPEPASPLVSAGTPTSPWRTTC
jgi:probable blue pigment (indigoidine) exporter